MKIKITKAALKSALDKCASTVPTKASLPVLSTALFEAIGETLSITVTNMEQRVTAKTECEIEEEGSVCIPFKRIQKWVDCVSGDITLSANDKNVIVHKCGRAEGKISGLAASEFVPKGESGKPAQEFADKDGSIGTMLAKLKSAMSDEQTRPVLCGVHFGSRGGNLRLTSSDGRRIHILSTSLKSEADAIVPSGAVLAIMALFAETQCEFRLFENRIQVTSELTDFESKIIEGNFPDIERATPQPVETGIVMPVDQFNGAMKEVESTLPDHALLTIKSTKKTVTFTTANGEDMNTSEIEAKQKGEFLFHVNYQYLKDSVSALDGDSFKIEITEPRNPIAIREGDFTAVIVPRVAPAA